MSPRRLKDVVRRLLPGAAAALAAAVLIGSAWVVWIGWWMDFSEEPRESDLMVVMAGGFTRPYYAAELYQRGYAPRIWLSQPVRPAAVRKAVAAGADIPAEAELNRRILLGRGVPARAIRLYGKDIMSTYHEALALRREAEVDGKKVLAVTSRWHARRIRVMFRRLLPESDVRVAGVPDPFFTRFWWRRRELSEAAILETAKIVFYLSGGRFISPIDETPQQD